MKFRCKNTEAEEDTDSEKEDKIFEKKVTVLRDLSYEMLHS